MAAMLKESTLVYSLTAKYSLSDLSDLSICCEYEDTLIMSENCFYSIQAAWRTETVLFFRQALTQSLIMS